METSALSGVKVTDMIARMQSLSGAGDVPEDSRRVLLQAAKELQHSLETPKETCDRLHYSTVSFTSGMPHVVDLPRFLAQTDYQNPTDSTRTVAQLTRSTSLHYFDWMKQKPEHFEALNKAMAANRMAKTGIDAFPFEDRLPDLFKKDQNFDSSSPLLVDIGGGRGQMSRAFSIRCPHVPGRIIFQDLPQALTNVPSPASSSEGSSSSSIEPMAHDLFQRQPITGARIYYLRHVLHDWPDKQAELILKNTVEAMR
ncbi:MAG: hypothetical protein LQ345_003198, partial [Seirophora villosa]